MVCVSDVHILNRISQKSALIAKQLSPWIFFFYMKFSSVEVKRVENWVQTLKCTCLHPFKDNRLLYQQYGG